MFKDSEKRKMECKKKKKVNQALYMEISKDFFELNFDLMLKEGNTVKNLFI